MTLYEWAKRWSIPLQAVNELRAMWNEDAADVMPGVEFGESESAVQAVVRLEAARKGLKMWRNNVGVLKDDTGRPVRYGLANDSPALNKVVKSGDLIGIRPVLITHEHVGHTIGQFVSRECKRVGWQYCGTEREVAQLNWARLVIANGGDAKFTVGEGSL